MLPGAAPYITTAAGADPDLRDLDMHGFTITGVARLGNEFVVTLTGGSGSVVNHLTGVKLVTQREGEATIGLGYNESSRSQKTADDVGTLLRRWEEERTELHLASAPGMLSVLAENTENYLAFPRGK